MQWPVKFHCHSWLWSTQCLRHRHLLLKKANYGLVYKSLRDAVRVWQSPDHVEGPRKTWILGEYFLYSTIHLELIFLIDLTKCFELFLKGNHIFEMFLKGNHICKSLGIKHINKKILNILIDALITNIQPTKTWRWV